MNALPLFLAGGRGLMAGEFLRFLSGHSVLVLEGVSSRGGEASLADAHPQLAGAQSLRPDQDFLPHCELAGPLATRLKQGPAVLVMAMNHGQAAPFWTKLESDLQAAVGERLDGLTVVDLSADYRLPTSDSELTDVVHAGAPWRYGLPELHPMPQGTRRIASAGCFATAMQLAVVPAARAGLLERDRPMVVHGVTGSSGSGAQPKAGTHHPHRHGNLWAYAWQGHRHEDEVMAQRNFPEGAPPLHFIACSGPFARGIHLSAALPLAREVSPADARSVFGQAYRQAACVRVLDSGAPQLRTVTGSNRADLAVGVRGDLLHVFVTLDNLVKGGSGQALQCLNLALGLPETEGLPLAALGC